jgi:uncharacterized repeat protein (TIGR01451 family)
MFSNFIRCTGLTAILVIVAALGLPGASSAQIVIDGNANDLISATENPAPGTCGDSQDDSGDTATNAQNGEGTATPCTNYPGGDPGSAGDDYVNGFVLNLGAFFYDPAAEELYVAWRSAGVIGDVDADGDPTTFCAEAVGSGINEQPGISTNDEYRLEIDVDCTLGFGADIILRVTGDGAGNPVLQLVSGVFPFSGYDVDYNGSDLELRIDGVSLTNFPNFGFAMRLKSGTFDDTLAEDTVPPMTCEPPDPSVEITKECDDVCAGDATECTITVTNNGLVPLENIVVFDDIPAGHTFVQVVSGNVTPSAAGDNDYEFTLNNPLDPGADHTFTIEIQTPEDCFGDVTNNVDVEGEFTSECYDSEPTTRLAFDETSATYSCTPGVCLENLTAAGPGEVCSGGLFDICGTVDNCGVEAVEVVVKLNGGSDQVIVIPAQSTSEEFCFEGLSVSCDTDGAETVYTVTVENSATDDCGDDLETFDVTVTCRKPEICLTKDDDITGEGCVANDGDVTYTLVVENCGPTDLTDVVVADTVSCEFATYVADSATEGGVFAAGIITWDIGDLAEGDSRTLEYTVHIFVDGCTGQEACDNTAYAEGYCVEDQATDVATHTVCIECRDEVCLVIFDEDTIDNGMWSIEQAAASHGVTSDYLVNDDNPTEVGNPPLRWNTLFPGDIVLLPAGQVDDEGIFALPENTPWSLEDFAAGTVPQSKLDKIPDVMPVRNQDLVRLIGQTCVAVVYDSDISMNFRPINANLQGARYGLFTFTVLAVEVPGYLPEAQSSTSLYSLWVRVEPPMQPTVKFQIPVRDHEPDAIEIARARWESGTLTVIGSSDFAPGAYMTVSVDGPDGGSDHTVPPFLLEEPMVLSSPSDDEYTIVYPTPVDLRGRRVTISTDEGGAYNSVIGPWSGSPDLAPSEETMLPNRVTIRASSNPVRHGATLEYTVPRAMGPSPVQIQVFTATGRLVKTLLSATRDPGRYTERWDLTTDSGQRAATGVYLYRLIVGGQHLTNKLLVIRE